MARIFVRLAAVVALLGFGLSVYANFFYTPPRTDPPQYQDDHKPLPEEDAFERLAKTDPIAMYDACLKRYQREVTGGFLATLIKRERVRGEPKPPAEPHEEVIRLAVRGDVPDPDTNNPHLEVSMKWQSGPRKDFIGSEIWATRYSEKSGKEGTDGKVATWRPSALITVATIPFNSPLAQSQSRYCIRDAGLYGGMHRTYLAWKKRQEAGTLKAEYLGKEVIEQTGGRLCHVIRRTCDGLEVDPFERAGEADTSPENLEKSGFNSVTVMIDAERWLQVGTEIHRTGADGKPILIASYYFRDIELNPQFPPHTFTEEGMKKK